MQIDQMDETLIKAVLETIPAEITVIDANDEVAGWNKHETRIFKRPWSCVGLNFRGCHPASSLSKVIQIVDGMKAGTRDRARFWIDVAVSPGEPKHKLLIEFYALRDPAGKYLGCLECMQDVEDIRRLEGEKRLLD